MPGTHHRLPRSLAALLVAGIAGASCATSQPPLSPRPMVYPNAKVKKVGDKVAQADADACMERAELFGADPEGEGGEIAEAAAREGLMAAAQGAIGGLLGRDPTAIVGGIASAATGGAMRGALAGDSGPSPAFVYFVELCLKEQGYTVIGWTTDPSPGSPPTGVPATTVTTTTPPLDPALATEGPPSGTPREEALPSVGSPSPPSSEGDPRALALQARSEALAAWRSLEQSTAGGAGMDVSDRADVWLLLSESDAYFAEERFEEARGTWEEASQEVQAILVEVGSH